MAARMVRALTPRVIAALPHGFNGAVDSLTPSPGGFGAQP
jgi:hypothetical protein